MPETADPTFRCDVCGRRHRWTPDLAGQTIACQCLEPVPVPPEPENDLYDLAPVPVEPIPAQIIQEATTAHSASSTLSYQRPLEPGLDETYSDANPLIVSVTKDLVVPISLILLGTFTTFVWAYHSDPGFAAGTPSKAHAALSVGATFTYDILVLLVAIIISARVLGTSFGNVPTAILKLGAVAIGPAGLRGLLILSLGANPYTLALGWMLGIALYFFLLWYLFQDLEGEDLWGTVGIIFITRLLTSVAWALLIH